MTGKKLRRYGTGSVYEYKNGNTLYFRWQAKVLANPNLGEDGWERKSAGGFKPRAEAESAMHKALLDSKNGQAALASKE